MTINIVIPVLNEEKILKNGIERTIYFLDTTKVKDKYCITIADNGSTDGTEEIAKNLCKKYSYVNYLKISCRGVGAAFREAIKCNTEDIIGYMDIDLATDIRHLKQVYRVFLKDNADIVVGSRLLPKSKVYNRTLLREFTSRALNKILKLFLNVQFSDAMCGFKFYKREVAEQLVKISSNEKGWFFCAEMMIRAEWSKIPIREIAVIWHDDPDSKVKAGKVSVNYMIEIIKLWKEKRGIIH